MRRRLLLLALLAAAATAQDRVRQLQENEQILSHLPPPAQNLLPVPVDGDDSDTFAMRGLPGPRLESPQAR